LFLNFISETFTITRRYCKARHALY